MTRPLLKECVKGPVLENARTSRERVTLPRSRNSLGFLYVLCGHQGVYTTARLVVEMFYQRPRREEGPGSDTERGDTYLLPLSSQKARERE